MMFTNVSISGDDVSRRALLNQCVLLLALNQSMSVVGHGECEGNHKCQRSQQSMAMGGGGGGNDGA